MRHTLFLLWAVLLTALLLPAQTAQRKVTLTWEDALNPSATTTYNAYRAPGDCTGTPVFTKLNTAPIPVRTYEDVGPAPGTYCYVVRAVSVDALESANSNTATAVVGAPPVVPGAPSNLSVAVSVTVTVHP